MAAAGDAGAMDNERIREFCMGLPYVTETFAWGHHAVYWAGDRDLGGKMFALTDLDGSGEGVLTFHCGEERFHELLEREGIRPAPYSARYFWVTLERWDALRPREIEDELRRSHALIYAKLPARTKAILELPAQERAKILQERRGRPGLGAKKRLAGARKAKRRVARESKGKRN